MRTILAYFPHRRHLDLVGQRWMIASGLLTLLITAACAPPRKQPPQPLPLNLDNPFSSSGTAEPASEWWTAFEDADLNALIDTALAGNFNLQAAWARLDQAAALTRQARASLTPSLSLEASAASSDTHNRTSADSPQVDGSSLSLGLSASYELDLWGRLRAERTAARHQQQASEADVKTTALALAGEVTTAWFQVAKQQALLDILDRQEASNRDYLNLIRLRLQQGQASGIDYLQQQRKAASIQAQRPLVQRDLLVGRQRLSILLGQPPTAHLPTATAVLPTMPALPATGLPAALLSHRPDLQAAQFRLAAADQDLAVAIANQYPALRLTAQANADGMRSSDLFHNWLTTLAGNLVTPLLDGEQRRAEVKRNRALVAEQLHAYGHATLVAMGEVEEALISEQQQDLYLVALTHEHDLARRTLDETLRRYRQGLGDYLPVLDAIVTLQQLERNLLDARHQRLEVRIALYRALGSDWQPQRVHSQKKEHGS